MDIYFETGQKKTFACAVDWPGWSRSGRDEEQALQALLASAPRYALVLAPAALMYVPPADTSAFKVTERIQGGSGTDFGAPEAVPAVDARPVTPADRDRFHALLHAYWAALDAACQAALGKELRKGPRGGGRELDGIIEHTLQADLGYLRMLGWKMEKQPVETRSLDEKLALVRQAILAGLDASIRGELPQRGPRGGQRWSPRYYVRRAGWHTLDHAWEIEDRIV